MDDRSRRIAQLSSAAEGSNVPSDLVNVTKAGDWIVCGWFTPDYRHWAEQLVGDLERLSIPYHFEAVAKARGGWNVNTLQKANVVLRALKRYPGKRVILLDVDCNVQGDLSPLAQIDCDIALYFRARRRKERWYSWFRINQKASPTLLQPRSGTMLFVPTKATGELLQRWSEHSNAAQLGDDDETALANAIGSGSSLTIHCLETKWAAIVTEPNTVVLHVSAHALQLQSPKTP